MIPHKILKNFSNKPVLRLAFTLCDFVNLLQKFNRQIKSAGCVKFCCHFLPRFIYYPFNVPGLIHSKPVFLIAFTVYLFIYNKQASRLSPDCFCFNIIFFILFRIPFYCIVPFFALSCYSYRHSIAIAFQPLHRQPVHLKAFLTSRPIDFALIAPIANHIAIDQPIACIAIDLHRLTFSKTVTWNCSKLSL